MKKVVMAFGAFDGIHAGHIFYLSEAKKLGDRLVVAIARDAAVWRPPTHYRLPEKERMALVKSLGIADTVILGGLSNAFEKIVRVRPDIIAITDYHGIDETVLQSDLQKRNLKTIVKKIRRYKPELYDAEFRRRLLSTRELMGLTPKKGTPF